MYYTYFLESQKNNKIYVGSTSKLPMERLKEHNSGCNIYTKANRPFRLVYYEEYDCITDARRRELFYKSGFGKQIRDIIVKYMSGLCQRSSAGRAAVS